MAETKQIKKARLKMKGETSEHWAKSDFVPIKNELVLVHDKGNIIVKDEDNDTSIKDLVNDKSNYLLPIFRGAAAFSTEEGKDTTAGGYASHAEGFYTQTLSDYAHAEGSSTIADGIAAHAEGINTEAFSAAHSEGAYTKAEGYGSHAEGICSNTQPTKWIIPQKYKDKDGKIQVIQSSSPVPMAKGEGSHVEGYDCYVSGNYSHAEGYNTYAAEQGSHAEGTNTMAYGQGAHAEGLGGKNTHKDSATNETKDYYGGAGGNGAHSEGIYCRASGEGNHAEGRYTLAIGPFSCHAEGYITEASANHTHAEGFNNKATAQSAHVEGRHNIAKHEASHVSGEYNISSAKAQTVVGYYNDDDGEALLIVGNGNKEKRTNAFVVRKDGTTLAGGKVLATEEFVNKINEFSPVGVIPSYEVEMGDGTYSIFLQDLAGTQIDDILQLGGRLEIASFYEQKILEYFPIFHDRNSYDPSIHIEPTLAKYANIYHNNSLLTLLSVEAFTYDENAIVWFTLTFKIGKDDLEFSFGFTYDIGDESTVAYKIKHNNNLATYINNEWTYTTTE